MTMNFKFVTRYKDTGRWDAAPIVVEKYKLVFFITHKVGCTVLKHFFSRTQVPAEVRAISSDIEIAANCTGSPPEIACACCYRFSP